jgi:hypothetical protein
MGFFIIQDKMVSAEIVGGKLKEAATKKADESIALIQIADKDLALKVKYHKQCYEKNMCKRFPQLVFSIDQSYETRVKLFMQSASVKQV